MSDTTILGRFVWHELMTTDTTSAKPFYAAVAGWTTQPSPQDPSYTVFVAEGSPMAGLMALPADAKAMGAPPSWMIYIATPDVDETARRATAMGGKILKPAADIPTVGRFAVLQDPQGAVFAGFTPAPGPMRPGNKPTVGDFSWHELSTTDWRAAFGFYQNLFGWEKTGSTDMGPEMGTYQMFGWNGKSMGGMHNHPKHVPGPAHWLAYAKVEDSKKAAAAVTRLGGRVVNGPMEVPGGDWVVQCLDLEGALFAVHSSKPAVEKPAVEKPAVEKPAVEKPAVGKPAVGKPAAGKAPAGKPVAAKPAAKKPVAARKRTRPATANKRTAKKPASKAKPVKKTPRKSAGRQKARTKGRATRGRR